MRYPDGETVRLGDRVELSAGFEGTVVCSIDTKEFSSNFPEDQWSYLREGVLIQTESGLIHCLEADEDFRLIERAR